MQMVTVQSKSGPKSTECLAEFVLPILGNDIRFMVTRALGSTHDVITHSDSGLMVCEIDYLDSIMLGSESAGRKSLDAFIRLHGDKAVMSIIQKASAHVQGE